jgi:hypothetical protein
LVINPLEIHILNDSSDTNVYSNNITLPLFNLPANFSIVNGTLDVNGIQNLSGKDILNSKAQKITYLSLKQDNLLFFESNNQTTEEKTITSKDLIHFLNQAVTVNLPQVQSGSKIMVKIPKISGDQSLQLTQSDNRMAKVQNCDSFNRGSYSSSVNSGLLTLSSQNASACTSVMLNNPVHNLSYAIFVNSKNLQGRSLNFWLLNEDEGYSLLNTYLKTGSALQTSTFVIPPQENYGRAYSLHFDNSSIGNDKTVNSLGNISFYPIPYNFISSLVLSKNSEKAVIDKTITTIPVSHPNESLYLIKPGQIKKDSTIVLSQSFDLGWQAYVFNHSNPSLIEKALPFLGKKINTHILVNNWENGWRINNLNSNSAVILIYLPQYLQYLGDLLLVLLIVIIVIGLTKYAKRRTD